MTPLLRDNLHWLRVRERITFKLYLLVYKAMNGPAPSYMKELRVPVTTVATRSALRSAVRGDLVPRTRRQLGNRAFSVAGPTAWNSLPLNIRTAPTLSIFKNLLKTHLFTCRTICSNLVTVSNQRVGVWRCTAQWLWHVTAPYKLSYYYYYYYYYYCFFVLLLLLFFPFFIFFKPR